MLAIPSVVLLAAGLLLYVGSIAVDVIHVARQYSSAMKGSGAILASAALAAAAKRWYYLAMAVLGAVLLVVAR